MPTTRLRDVRAAVRRVKEQRTSFDSALSRVDQVIDRAGQQVVSAREAIIREEFVGRVDRRPVTALRDGGAPIDLLQGAGLADVGAVRRMSEASLRAIRGIGPAKASATLDAVYSLDCDAATAIRVLPDPDARRRGDTPLLEALDRVAALQREIVPHAEAHRRWRDEIVAHIDTFTNDARRLGWLRGRDRRAEIAERAAWLEWAFAVATSQLTSLASQAQIPPGDRGSVWQRYATNTAPFVAVLEVFGGNRVPPPPAPRAPRGAPGAQRPVRRAPKNTPQTFGRFTPTRTIPDLRGGLPAAIADAVESFDLDRGPLTATLRRYQEFGARYIALQERSLIGDDMGLGKTVQVLAAMCHLHANGQRHFVVVAPNSVLLNWEREVDKHTDLVPYVVHGSQRQTLLRAWGRTGGVAVTTFGTLPAVLASIGRIDLLAVDEAHFVKNPKAKRSQAVAELSSRSDAVTFLTGTALENRVGELHTLVTTVQPALTRTVAALAMQESPNPAVVRERLAPVYLRRTREDVLEELPECVPVEEWLDLAAPDRLAYDDADRNIMAQRRAAVAGAGTGRSAKFDRLRELLEHYAGESRKVVVFSYFRDVLDHVAEIAGGCDQINGSITAGQRQAVIDRFTECAGHAVLAAQIDAGGIGINLQAAQVVIIMEPQFTPSSEAQAIGRVHRQGQSRRVTVHRLLARNTIEERLVELLKQKGIIFDMYANPSAVKDASEMASDGSSFEEELKRLLGA